MLEKAIIGQPKTASKVVGKDNAVPRKTTPPTDNLSRKSTAEIKSPTHVIEQPAAMLDHFQLAVSQNIVFLSGKALNVEKHSIVKAFGNQVRKVLFYKKWKQNEILNVKVRSIKFRYIFGSTRTLNINYRRNCEIANGQTGVLSERCIVKKRFYCNIVGSLEENIFQNFNDVLVMKRKEQKQWVSELGREFFLTLRVSNVPVSFI